MKTKLLPLLSALMIVFCTTCENPWMQELVDPLFLKKLVGWTAVSESTFAGQEMSGIAYGNGKFVAVGSSGSIFYSSNGINWTQVTNSTFPLIIHCITYGNSRFVAAGNGGNMAYSNNGINWTQVTNHPFTPGNNIQCIAYGGGRFVASGGHRPQNGLFK